MPLDPIDPKPLALTPEQRTADKFAVLDRRVGTAERGSLTRGKAQGGGGTLQAGAGGQTLTNGVLTVLSWNAVAANGTAISWGPNLTQMILLVGGMWAVSANVEFASNATGYRRMEVVRNGAARRVIQVSVQAANGHTTALSGSQIIHCTAGDYLELYCQQNSGGNLDVLPIPGSSINTEDPFMLTAVRIGG